MCNLIFGLIINQLIIKVQEISMLLKFQSNTLIDIGVSEDYINQSKESNNTNQEV